MLLFLLKTFLFECSVFSKIVEKEDRKMSVNNTIKLLNCKQVANLLGVSVKTIYSYIGYKQFPSNMYRKIGKKPIFIYDEVERWFLNGATLLPRNHKTAEKNPLTAVR